MQLCLRLLVVLAMVSRTVLLLHHPVTEAIDLDYPGKNLKDYLWLVGSVNGLICLAISLFNGVHDLFLWNPSTRKYNKLHNYRLNQSRGYYLEKRGKCKFGFAYDELQDDYKVVGIFPIYKGIHLCRVEVQIYSLRSNSWRRINDFQGRFFLHVSGKLVNGKLYWLENGRNISSIDLCSEKWTETEKSFIFKEYGHFILGVLVSDLSVLCNYMWCHADVWIMKEYGVKESSTKMFTIESANDGMPCIRKPPILVTNEGDILLEIGSLLGKYNPKDYSFRYLDVTNFAPYMEAEIYVKSLFVPFSIRDNACKNNGSSYNSDEINRVTNNITTFLFFHFSCNIDKKEVCIARCNQFRVLILLL